MFSCIRGTNSSKSSFQNEKELTLRRDTLPRLPTKKTQETQKINFSRNDIIEEVLTSHQRNEKDKSHSNKSIGVTLDNRFQTIARCNTSEVIFENTKFTTHSLPRTNSHSNRTAQEQYHNKQGNDFLEMSDNAPSPPPKPPKNNSQKCIKDQQLQRSLSIASSNFIYNTKSGSDSGTGSGDSTHSSLITDSTENCLKRGVILKNPRFINSSFSTSTLKSLPGYEITEDQLFMLKLPEFRLVSKFDVENYTTVLLPIGENKPLDGETLNTFKIMLFETGPRMIAEHITRIDVNLIISDIPEPNDENENIICCCGMELLSLPHGKIFRNDLIERVQCIKLMVAVTILTCRTDEDRADIISRWIEIAIELKNALGNLFGFSAVMLGLCMQQVIIIKSNYFVEFINTMLDALITLKKSN